MREKESKCCVLLLFINALEGNEWKQRDPLGVCFHLMQAWVIKKGGVMVNFMYQLGWATVPRYVFKCYSGYLREAVFG